jgi:hypothetical protein
MQEMGGTELTMSAAVQCGQRVAGEGFQERMVLHVWGHDYSMFVKAEDKGLTAPPAHQLHHVEGDATEQVFECGTNAYTMAFQVVTAHREGNGGDAVEEGPASEGPHPLSVSVGEKVISGGRVIDEEVIAEGGLGVCGTLIILKDSTS